MSKGTLWMSGVPYEITDVVLKEGRIQILGYVGLVNEDTHIQVGGPVTIVGEDGEVVGAMIANEPRPVEVKADGIHKAVRFPLKLADD